MMIYPSLYQLNTRILLNELSPRIGRPATLDDVPDAMLDEIAQRGFAWVWFLGVWQTGEAARQVSRSNAKLRREFTKELPDLREEDIVGSPFAVKAWTAHQDFGGDHALGRLRKRLSERGIKLLLDFVPNHVAPDHVWATTHPEYIVQGSDQDIAREPQNYVRMHTPQGTKIMALGRDPFFDGWPDTLQLNYRHAGFCEAQVQVLGRIAERCDGVRCDMAMLLQPEVFARTWGERAKPADGTPPSEGPFWPRAITAVRRRFPSFLFLAEVYWDLEWDLQQVGFDYTYDKRLYDRLSAREARPVRDHLRADMQFQEKSARFLENHDEPRAAATFDEPVHRAAAVITYLVPGLRFFHEGQFEGRKVHASMHLGRRPAEPVVPSIQEFYRRLLAITKDPAVRNGRWQLWECRQAWEGNPTHEQFLVMTWDGEAARFIAVVNYGASQGQCYVTLGLPGLAGRSFTLIDRLGDARYDRDGDGLTTSGLYLDLPAWGAQVLELTPR
jgi:glycosidase